MGQYYLLLNLTKRQYFERSFFEKDGKVWEFGSKKSELIYDGDFQAMLGALVLDTVSTVIGSWSGCRIVIIGDYSHENYFYTQEDLELYADKNLYYYARKHFQPIPTSSIINDIKPIPLDPNKHEVILNLDKKQYLDPRNYGYDTSFDGFALQNRGVLSELLKNVMFSSSSEDDNWISTGRWAGDRISIVDIAKIDLNEYKLVGNKHQYQSERLQLKLRIRNLESQLIAAKTTIEYLKQEISDLKTSKCRM